jgi:hypothetical protein
MRLLLVVIWIILIMSATYAFSGENQVMSESNLIARHQRCVLDAFARNAKSAREFDPNLLNKSVEQCEGLLEPLKKTIVARSRDQNFADTILSKIRAASKRGVAVALSVYLERERQRYGGTPR